MITDGIWPGYLKTDYCKSATKIPEAVLASLRYRAFGAMIARRDCLHSSRIYYATTQKNVEKSRRVRLDLACWCHQGTRLDRLSTE